MNRFATPKPEYCLVRTGQLLCSIGLFFLYAFGLAGCNDVSTAPPPPSGPGPLAITSNTLPDATLNHPYATVVGGSGGTGPYSWAVTPALPNDLVFDTTTGAITGVPSAQGTTSHTFTLRDSSSPSQSAQKSLSFTVSNAPAVLSITTLPPLPNGNVGQVYSQTVQATGGTGALTWSVLSGNLPQNLSLTPTTGVISGTPTAIGTSAFTLRVVDTAGQVDTQGYSIVINPATPPTITTTSPLPGGTVGMPYNQTLQAIGGTGMHVWSRASGSLPANLSLSATGMISGTPTNPGNSNFTVRVTDALSQSDTQPLSIAISAALMITTNSLPNARIARNYNQTLQRSGGVQPFTWSVSPALPTGLNLNASTGAITGTPSLLAVGTHSLTFTVRDSSSPTNLTATKTLNLTITL